MRSPLASAQIIPPLPFACRRSVAPPAAGRLVLWLAAAAAACLSGPARAEGPGRLSPPVILGHKLGHVGAEGADQERGGPLKLPIGQRVYRSIVEVEDPDAIKPGTTVDVWHVTLGDEGPTARRLLRRVVIVSEAAASYIAVPAVQRIAIPEASPTLPLAASLGLTFTWNVTVGIPIYIEIARWIVTTVPLAG